MFKSRKSPSRQAMVGLDLDPSHIAAAEATANGSVALLRGAVSPLAAGILRDGEVADAPALIAALRAFFTEHELPTRVRLGIANQRIVVRTLDLPVAGDRKALGTSVHAEVPDHLPMPMDEAVMDWQLLGEVETAEGPRSRVLVVAVRREAIERLAAVLAEAGLQLEGIDLSAFGMIRALQAPDAGAVVYISVAGLTNVAVANGSGCLFTRAAAGGLDTMGQLLAERRSLTLEHARQWMVHTGLETPVEDLAGEPELIAATRSVLDDGVHQLADTLRNSLNFYGMQDGAQAIERGLVTGPAVNIPGFVATLSDLLHIPLVPATVAAADPELDVGSLTVAAGLALESRT